VLLAADDTVNPLTASTYCHNLRHFLDFLQREGVDSKVESVTTALVRKWVVAMHHYGLSHSTVARHLYALRSFWHYLHQCGHAEQDPVSDVSVPKRQQRVPKYLGADDLRRLLDAAQRSPSVFCGFRNYAMMTTLIFTGMRRAELISLHTLRHSMATLLLQSGQCTLVEIQRILGHSRLDTTAIYLHVTEGELRKAVRAHPLAMRCS